MTLCWSFVAAFIVQDFKMVTSKHVRFVSTLLKNSTHSILNKLNAFGNGTSCMTVKIATPFVTPLCPLNSRIKLNGKKRLVQLERGWFPNDLSFQCTDSTRIQTNVLTLFIQASADLREQLVQLEDKIIFHLLEFAMHTKVSVVKFCMLVSNFSAICQLDQVLYTFNLHIFVNKH